ncbi:unnamed protein product [Amaranthus hypochondriacus]
MEAWLAELEMEIDPVNPLMNNCYNESSETTMINSFNEQLAATLGEDFPYLFSAESNTNSPQWDIDSILVGPVTPPTINSTENHCYNNNNNNNDINSNDDDKGKQIKKKENQNSSTKQGTKRKRQPSQVQDHILAERKRRELLSQLFISLSALVPGLKKMDKTSVLGEAIKYMKRLQENVKTLEEVVAKRTVESMVVVKKSQLVVDNNNGDDNESSSTVDDNCASGTSANGGGGDGGSSRDVESGDGSLPEIEVKISGKTMLLKVYCENHKRILANLFSELDKYNVTVTSSSVVTFESLALDITIVAQIEEGFNRNIKKFVRNLRSALLSRSD